MDQTIYKHCKEKHNLALDCTTIQLGTLEYYRNLEPGSEILDIYEGITSGKVDGDPVTFFDQEANLDGIAKVAKGAKLEMSVSGGIETTIPNTFIFCASTQSENKSWESYNSTYQIADVRSFCKLIIQKLEKMIAFDNFDLTGLSIIDLMNIQITAYTKEVEYIEKPLRLTNDNKDVLKKMLNSPLVDKICMKPEDYQEENEYRIVFVVTCNNKIVPVKKSSVIVDLDPLKDCVHGL